MANPEKGSKYQAKTLCVLTRGDSNYITANLPFRKSRNPSMSNKSHAIRSIHTPIGGTSSDSKCLRGRIM
jgi:hypothetical protein